MIVNLGLVITSCFLLERFKVRQVETELFYFSKGEQTCSVVFINQMTYASRIIDFRIYDRDEICTSEFLVEVESFITKILLKQKANDFCLNDELLKFKGELLDDCRNIISNGYRS